MNQTKVLCTIGPASDSKDKLRSLMELGMSIARINLSHGRAEDHFDKVKLIRELDQELGRHTGILFDTRGCEIRTGERATPLEIKEGASYQFISHSKAKPSEEVITVNYDHFAQDVGDTKVIIVDSGTLRFQIDSVKDGVVHTTALDDGLVTSRRHINLPGADIDLPSITEDDWSDIRFGIDNDIDFVALSFIRSPEEVEEVRQLIDKSNSRTQIMTKIETVQSLEKIDAIIDASDAIMIARGDLGAEMPIEKLPAVQADLVRRCRMKSVPVVVATHMLESMIEHPIPTRAEVTDIAHAVSMSVDATMLSGETAAGEYPEKSLDMMRRVTHETEIRRLYTDEDSRQLIHNDDEAQAHAAVQFAHYGKADALLVFTRSGKTAREVSSFRPLIPIIAACPNDQTARLLSLPYGVHAFTIDFTAKDVIDAAIDEGKKKGYLREGMNIVLLSGSEANGVIVESVQMHTV